MNSILHTIQELRILSEAKYQLDKVGLALDAHEDSCIPSEDEQEILRIYVIHQLHCNLECSAIKCSNEKRYLDDDDDNERNEKKKRCNEIKTRQNRKRRRRMSEIISYCATTAAVHFASHCESLTGCNLLRSPFGLSVAPWILNPVESKRPVKAKAVTMNKGAKTVTVIREPSDQVRVHTLN